MTCIHLCAKMNNSHFQLKNPNLNADDVLYHINLTAKQDLSIYRDVKFVCMGGKPSRMLKFANKIYEMLDFPGNSVLDYAKKPLDIACDGGRYCMYKVGPVLSVSHGIGMPSLSVILNELFKLLHYAKASKDVIFIRMGSSGGLGVEAGTLVITEQPYNSTLETEFVHVAIGKQITLPCITCSDTRKKLITCAQNLKIPAIVGNTIGTDDFFEGQCRLDGAFCDYDDKEKMAFLKNVHDTYEIKNIEMECVCFAALCHRAGLKCAIVCATFLDRLKGDAVNITQEEMNKWEQRLFDLVGSFIVNNKSLSQ